MKFLKLLDDHIEEWLLLITYTAMLIIGTAQVFFRYVINISLSWSQDLLTYILIWSVFIGISLAVRERRHIKVELAFLILPEKAIFYLKVISNYIFIIFCGIISYFSLEKVYKLIFINPQMSEATGLPMWIIQIAIPFGLILSIYRLIIDTKLLYKEREAENKGGSD